MSEAQPQAALINSTSPKMETIYHSYRLSLTDNSSAKMTFTYLYLLRNVQQK
jgi:hypothetical protein